MSIRSTSEASTHAQSACWHPQRALIIRFHADGFSLTVPVALAHSLVAGRVGRLMVILLAGRTSIRVARPASGMSETQSTAVEWRGMRGARGRSANGRFASGRLRAVRSVTSGADSPNPFGRCSSLRRPEGAGPSYTRPRRSCVGGGKVPFRHGSGGARASEIRRGVPMNGQSHRLRPELRLPARFLALVAGMRRRPVGTHRAGHSERGGGSRDAEHHHPSDGGAQRLDVAATDESGRTMCAGFPVNRRMSSGDWGRVEA